MIPQCANMVVITDLSFAAGPGTTMRGMCGLLFGTTTRRAIGTTTSAFGWPELTTMSDGVDLTRRMTETVQVVSGKESVSTPVCRSEIVQTARWQTPVSEPLCRD